jgi:hypothetical protein
MAEAGLAVRPFSYFSIYPISTIVEITMPGENPRQFSPK